MPVPNTLGRELAEIAADWNDGSDKNLQESGQALWLVHLSPEGWLAARVGSPTEIYPYARDATTAPHVQWVELADRASTEEKWANNLRARIS